MTYYDMIARHGITHVSALGIHNDRGAQTSAWENLVTRGDSNPRLLIANKWKHIS